MTVEIQNIPTELRERHQWVVWRLRQRGGKDTKVPFQASGQGGAKTTDPATWSSFEDACDAWRRGGFDGIGFVFSEADPFTGIDLDKALDGDGEIYGQGRYFTVTGRLLTGAVPRILEAQAAVDRIHAHVFGKPETVASAPPLDGESVLTRAFKSQHGSKIEVLWRGDISGYRSHSEADLALCSHLWFWTNGDREQVDRLFRKSGLMRQKWERDDYRCATLDRASSGQTVSKPQQRERARRQSLDRETGVPVELAEDDRPEGKMTHKANAWRIVQHLGGCLRYTEGLGFLVFDGRRWEPSEIEARRLAGCVSRVIMEEVSALEEELSTVQDEEQRKGLERHIDALRKWAQRSENGPTIRESLDMSKAALRVGAKTFDANAFLLNVENGTIELTTGSLREHSAQDFLTQLAPVRYDPDAEAPRWEQFLEEITGGRESLVRYLQTALGYSITGSVREQCLFFAFGQGQNGKSTLLDILRTVLGPGYIKKAAPNLLMSNHRETGHPSEIADLRGARLVICQEVGKRKAFDIQRLKELTGEQALKAREMYGDWFEFEASFKIWMAANHRPRVDDNSHAFWRRVQLIPFDQAIHNPQRDLLDRLSEERAGILNWLVDGAKRYIAEGLGTSLEVTQAVEDYREESDSLGQFISDCCEVEEGLEVKATELWHAYECYVCERGLRSIKRGDLKSEMLNRGFGRPPRRKTGFFYTGLDLTLNIYPQPVNPVGSPGSPTPFDETLEEWGSVNR